jgi:hypothetical protein
MPCGYVIVGVRALAWWWSSGGGVLLLFVLLLLNFSSSSFFSSSSPSRPSPLGSWRQTRGKNPDVAGFAAAAEGFL